MESQLKNSPTYLKTKKSLLRRPKNGKKETMASKSKPPSNSDTSRERIRNLDHSSEACLELGLHLQKSETLILSDRETALKSHKWNNIEPSISTSSTALSVMIFTRTRSKSIALLAPSRIVTKDTEMALISSGSAMPTLHTKILRRRSENTATLGDLPF